MKKIYLAGPMSGIVGWNAPTFNAYAAFLRTRYPEAVIHNPADLIPELEKESHATAMRVALEALLEQDAIALLPGWEDSRGAQLEYAVARALGLPIIYAEPLAVVAVSRSARPEVGV